MNKKIIYAFLILAAIFIGFYQYKKFRVAPSIKLSSLALVDLNNEPVNMTSFRGKKIILSFGASWCGNCIDELNTLKAIKSEQLADVEIIVISDEPIERVVAFKERRNYPFTFLKMNYAFQTIGVNAIPTSYIINTALEVKKEKVGYIDWKDPSTLEHLKTLMH